MTNAKTSNPPAVPVAIIGMGCFFPKSPGLKAFWRQIANAEDAIGDVPASHWSAEDYFDADPRTPDHTYCTRGGFLPPVMFDPAEFGIPPNTLEATDTSQLLGLMAAKAALTDAGYGDGDRKSFDRRRTSVILGVTGTQELVIPLGARLGFPRWRRALKDAGVASATADEVIKRISDAYVSWQENSFPGLLGNVVAGRISNRLDLGGTNCVVDAACASSLSAVHMALMELAAGRSDMVITGGVDTLNDIFMHMCFAKTHVLSPTGDARPFSKDADGTVLGEGIGLLVIKRLTDAENDGDRVYAVIRGIGSASDGKSQSIYAPRTEGQVQALRQAYAQAGIDPKTVELIEAHGTGTRVGDVVEFGALRRVLDCQGNDRPQCALGSVKSMIGHTKAAAGAAGLIKAALALHHKVLPPTLKAAQADPQLGIEKTRFYLNTLARPWLPRKDHPRRCGVSAFGFGGSNFHVVLEEHRTQKTDLAWDGGHDIVAVSGVSKNAVLAAIEGLKKDVEEGMPVAEAALRSRRGFSADDACRLLWVVEDTGAKDRQPDREQSTFLTLAAALTGALSSGKAVRRPGIFYGEGRRAGKLAFLFPGQGSQYPQMGRDWMCRFPAAFETLVDADRRFDGRATLSRALYPVPPGATKEAARKRKALRRTELAQPAIGAVSLAMLRVLAAFGVRPDATAGHSFGELTALHAAGWIDQAAFLDMAVARGRLMAAAGQRTGTPASGMLAIKAPLADIEDLLATSRLDIVLANRNAPRQGVVAGPIDALASLRSICRDRGLACSDLHVAAAFHSRHVQAARDPFGRALKTIEVTPTGTPVFSNTTGGPYPFDPAGAAALLGDQLVQPVDFLTEIENLYAAGMRTFLEIGPRGILTGLVGEILADRGVAALAVDGRTEKSSGLEDLALTLCRLAAIGHPVALTAWNPNPGKRRRPMMQIPLTGANYRSSRGNDKRPSQLGHRPSPQGGPSPQPDPDRDLRQHPVDRSEQDPESPAPMNKRTPDTPPDPPAGNRPDPLTPAADDWLRQALTTLQQGLASMQALQQQTAEAHQKFLDAQLQTGRSLQSLMTHTRRLVDTSMGHSAAQPHDHDGLFDPPPGRVEPVGTPAHTPGRADEKIAATVANTHETPPVTVVEDDHRPQSPAATGIDAPAGAADLERILLAVVSELTGYPVDMINPEMDIEADLGIDSIKRVEILSTLEERLPALPAVAPAEMGQMKTLRQVVDRLAGGPDAAALGAPPAAEAVQTRPAATAADRDRDGVMQTLLAVVGDLTGYPVDMLKPEMDIEADLGIDSIKRVEILSAIEEKMPGLRGVSPTDMGRLRTLEQIADHLGGAAGGSAADGLAPQPQSPARGASKTIEPTGKAPEKQKTAVWLRRRIVTPREAPLRNRRALAIPAGRKVFVTEDAGKMAAALVEEFKRRKIDAVLTAPGSLETEPDLSTAAGLVLIASTETATTDHDLKNLFDLAARCGNALVEAAERGGAVFASVTQMDGAFGFHARGFDHPLQGALPGLVKTAALEWPAVHCRAVDVAPDWSDSPAAVARVVDELLGRAPEDPVEIGLDADHRRTLTLVEASLPAEAPATGAPAAGDVVVVSGGARGVTAAAAVALARRFTPKMILLGRSPVPEPDPQWLEGLTATADVKRAILHHAFSGQSTPVQLETAFRRYMAAREVTATLTAIRATGAEAYYHPVDVRDGDAVQTLLKAVTRTHGPVRALVHGAGVLEDRLIVAKKPEHFQNVFDTKVIGLQNLLTATALNSLRHLVLFSSVTARWGNRGQSDYAMANEALNKIAQQLAVRYPDCRVTALNWGPWEGGMVSAALGREFRRRGVPLIPIDLGARHLVAEMGRAGGAAVEVIVDAAATAADERAPLEMATVAGGETGAAAGLSLSFQRDLDLRNHPVLGSHMIDGKAVVPLALMAEWFAHGALHENPGLLLQGLDDIRVLQGIKIDQENKHIRLMAGKARRKHDFYEVPLELRDGVKGAVEVIHSRAKAILADQHPPAPAYRIPEKLTRRQYHRTIAEIYDQILFHGPDMRGLRDITHLSAEGMVADIAPAPAPSAWMTKPLRNKWLCDPLAMDAAFQMLTVWCFEEKGAVSLPSYCAAYRQYRHRFPTGGLTAVLEVTAAGDRKMRGTVIFLDSDKSVVAQMVGCETVMDPGLQRAFKPAAA